MLLRTLKQMEPATIQKEGTVHETAHPTAQ